MERSCYKLSDPLDPVRGLRSLQVCITLAVGSLHNVELKSLLVMITFIVIFPQKSCVVDSESKS